MLTTKSQAVRFPPEGGPESRLRWRHSPPQGSCTRYRSWGRFHSDRIVRHLFQASSSPHP
jgi:hypothetical protein